MPLVCNKINLKSDYYESIGFSGRFKEVNAVFLIERLKKSEWLAKTHFELAVRICFGADSPVSDSEFLSFCYD